MADLRHSGEQQPARKTNCKLFVSYDRVQLLSIDRLHEAFLINIDRVINFIQRLAEIIVY